MLGTCVTHAEPPPRYLSRNLPLPSASLERYGRVAPSRVVNQEGDRCVARRSGPPSLRDKACQPPPPSDNSVE